MMTEWIVRDSLYGNIDVSQKVIIDLINTQEFQRLRRILQLGGGQYAFPSATHNRFTHGIGVYHLIDKIFKNNAFKILSEQEKLVTKIAGLLHDLGHGPFSHSFEGVTSINHEAWTIKIICDSETEVNQVLVKHKIDIDAICKIIAKKHPNKILLSLVSSQLDCDRMDYLLRDSYYTGVEYGNFDIDWIIQNIKIYKNQIMYDSKALFAIENYLLSRYHMYWQIYNHKVGLSFDHLLINIFKRLKFLVKINYQFTQDITLVNELLREQLLSVEKYLELDDYSLMSLFKNLIKEKDNILSDLAKRIVNRQFFKLISNYTQKDLKNYRKLLVELNYDLDYYLVIDKFSQPVLYQINDKKQAIKFIDKDLQIFSFEQKSQLVGLEKNNKQQDYILVPKEVKI